MKAGELERYPVLNWTHAREGRLHTVTVGLHHKLTRQAHRFSPLKESWNHPWLPLSRPAPTTSIKDTRFRHDFRHSNGVKFKCVASIYNAYYKVVFLLDSDVILGKVSQKKSRKKSGVLPNKTLFFQGPHIWPFLDTQNMFYTWSGVHVALHKALNWVHPPTPWPILLFWANVN